MCPPNFTDCFSTRRVPPGGGDTVADADTDTGTDTGTGAVADADTGAVADADTGAVAEAGEGNATAAAEGAAVWHGVTAAAASASHDSSAARNVGRTDGAIAHISVRSPRNAM